MRFLMTFASVAVLILGTPDNTFAAFTSVVIGTQTNADIRTYTNGSNYPSALSNLTVGGVPFALEQFAGNANTLGAIQSPAGNSLFSIPTNVLGATTVYTLINSAFGSFGSLIGQIDFIGTGGAFATFNLVEGVNVRDHFNSVFNNIVTDPTIVTANFAGDVRLDRQTFNLPASFATQTLTGINFYGTNAGIPQGEAFLAGATILSNGPVAVPVPPSLILALSGVLTLALRFRRLR